MIESLIGFAAVLTLVLLRMPIAFAMAIVGMIGMTYETNFIAAISLVSRLIIDTSQDYGLSVVPLFILMGLFVNKGGISRELYQVSNAFLGHFRGGLAMATIVACGGFAAICGSSLATAATMSKVVMPEMRKLGYSDELSSASIAAGGTLGILIPPSVILVIYGLLTETSIGKLFIAGIIPGILGILFYLVAVQISVYRNPAAGPAGRRFSFVEKMQALSGVWSVLLLFFLVIGGLYGALDFWPIYLTFSPTEAAGMGAMGAFLIALFRGSLSVRETITVLKETAATTAQLFSVLIGAWIFSNFVNYAGLPEGLLITPPVGLNVFILKSVVGDISVGTIFRGVTPFWMMDIVRLLILVLFPWLVLVLPSQM